MGMYIYILEILEMLPPQTLYLHLTYGPFGGFTMARTGHFSNDSSVGFPAGWLHWLVDPLFYLDSVLEMLPPPNSLSPFNLRTVWWFYNGANWAFFKRFLRWVPCGLAPLVS